MINKKKYTYLKNVNGITLIALIITIIILLILAGVSISLIVGENGVISQAAKAKTDTEVANEIELIESAITGVTADKYGEKIEKNDFQNELDKIYGNENVKVIKDGDEYIIKIIDSNRYYKTVNQKTLEGPLDIEENNDLYPGDITKDTNGNTLTGNEESPYEINCIEDLVDWSQNYKKYQEKYIVLKRTLDFQSELSYRDWTTNVYNEFLEIENDEVTLYEALTDEAYAGFKGITGFFGTFDGLGYEIQNIYINSDTAAGLFLTAGLGDRDTYIKNLGMTGNVTGTTDVASILANARYSVIIENCYNKCNIYNNTVHTGVAIYGTGGIVGIAGVTTSLVRIENCYNIGNIYSEDSNGYNGVGGIAGSNYGYKTIIMNNCYNIGEVYSNGSCTGGLIGYGGKVLYNSYNSGKSSSAGLAYHTACDIINCYNLGECINGIASYDFNQGTSKKYNIYNIGKYTKSPTYPNGLYNYTTHEYGNIFYKECDTEYEFGTPLSNDLMKSDGSTDIETEKALVTLLNEYVTEYNEEHKNDEDFVKLNAWKIDEEYDYPVFEI